MTPIFIVLVFKFFVQDAEHFFHGLVFQVCAGGDVGGGECHDAAGGVAADGFQALLHLFQTQREFREMSFSNDKKRHSWFSVMVTERCCLFTYALPIRSRMPSSIMGSHQ